VQNTAAYGTVAAMAAGAMATSNKAVMIVFIAFLFLSIWAGSSVRLAQHPLGLRARLTGVLASFRPLVALLGGRDLLLFAKHLFVATIAWQRCDLRRRCAVGGNHELTEEKGPGRWSWGASQAGASVSRADQTSASLRSACGRDVGGGENHFLSPTSSGRYRLVAPTAFRGFVR
jgi:hypothetical protein